MAQSTVKTVRVVIDIRTDNPEELIKILSQQKDSLGDHFTSVVLPSMGFDYGSRTQAGGNIIHEHEPEDRTCQALLRNNRMYRDDGQDEI